MRLLLLQIREDPRVRSEEYESFLRYCQLRRDELDALDLFKSPRIGTGILDGYDGLLVGGASAASVLEPESFPFVPSCVELLRHCVEVDFPVFASCFGFQLAVLALGGEIVRDEGEFAMGSLPISLRPAAATDLLFRDVPNGFYAISVHRERATRCPTGAIELAYTDRCCYAFRVIGKRFWAFQFHPEVDRKTLVARLTIYKATYTKGDAHLEEVIRNAVETPESNQLMRTFVERALHPRA